MAITTAPQQKMLWLLALFAITRFSCANLVGSFSSGISKASHAEDLLIEVLAPAPGAKTYESQVRLALGKLT